MHPLEQHLIVQQRLRELREDGRSARVPVATRPHRVRDRLGHALIGFGGLLVGERPAIEPAKPARREPCEPAAA